MQNGKKWMLRLALLLWVIATCVLSGCTDGRSRSVDLDVANVRPQSAEQEWLSKLQNVRTVVDGEVVEHTIHTLDQHVDWTCVNQQLVTPSSCHNRLHSGAGLSLCQAR